MKLSREKMFDWRWLNNQTKFYVFFRLLLMANFNDKPCELITVRRGQLMFSYESLSATLGVSVQTLRTTLRDLQKTNEINIQSTRRYSILTICDYDSWQWDENKTNIKSTYSQHTDNKQITLSEERNKEIKEENTNVSKKKNKNTFDVREDLSYVDCFEDLWREWLDYKDEIKKQYKTQRGAKSAFSQLKNLSNGDERKAKAILEQSYRKSWDGFFDIKDWDSLSRSQDLFPEQDGAGEQPKYLVINGEIYR